jgi:putative transposase
VARQCELIGLARSSYYYQAQGESDLNLRLMRLIDEQYTRTPFYGSPKLTAWLNSQGFAVNHKRVERLMRLMGIAAIVPGPKTSVPSPGHRVYPYLLRGLSIDRPNQVWSIDITYLPLASGWMYLVAIIDWFSRYVLAWELSVTMDVSFCLSALDWALARACPEIFNSDQGSQFTSQCFTDRLQAAGIQISMDGRGRALDNVFIERLWRSVKYEEVYIRDYRSPADAFAGLSRYFPFYNTERPHQALGYRTPAEVHFAVQATRGHDR